MGVLTKTGPLAERVAQLWPMALIGRLVLFHSMGCLGCGVDSVHLGAPHMGSPYFPALGRPKG